MDPRPHRGKLAHAGLSDITIEAPRGRCRHPHRPSGDRDRQIGERSRRAAQRSSQADRQAGESEHPRGQTARARRQARRPVDRRAAAEPGRLSPGDETRSDLGDALRRQGRQGPGLGPPRRCRDGADRKLLRRPRAAAHAARRHRLRLFRGPHDDRPDRRQMLDQQGRGDARGLPLRLTTLPRRRRRAPTATAVAAVVGRAGRGGRRRSWPGRRPAAVPAARRRPAAAAGGGGRGPGGRGRPAAAAARRRRRWRRRSRAWWPGGGGRRSAARRRRPGLAEVVADADAETSQAPQTVPRSHARRHRGQQHVPSASTASRHSSAVGSPTARSRLPGSR